MSRFDPDLSHPDDDAERDSLDDAWRFQDDNAPSLRSPAMTHLDPKALEAALKNYDRAVEWHSYAPHHVDREAAQHRAAAVLADEVRRYLAALLQAEQVGGIIDMLETATRLRADHDPGATQQALHWEKKAGHAVRELMERERAAEPVGPAHWPDELREALGRFSFASPTPAVSREDVIEECAKVADVHATSKWGGDANPNDILRTTARSIAAHIRALSSEPHHG